MGACSVEPPGREGVGGDGRRRDAERGRLGVHVHPRRVRRRRQEACKRELETTIVHYTYTAGLCIYSDTVETVSLYKERASEDVLGYSDDLRDRHKCHCKRVVTLTTSFSSVKLHSGQIWSKKGVIVTGVNVTE